MTDVPETVCAIRIAPAASAQAVAEYDRLMDITGADAADDWRVGLLAAWASLATFPLRCPVSPEDAPFQQFRPGPPLRVFLYRRKYGTSVWRILFTAHEATTDDPPFVQVHQLRHGAQAPLTQWPADDDV